MNRQLGFHHDMQRCTGCRTCVTACRSSHRLEPGVAWREVYAYPEEPGRYYLSVACGHCVDPECLRVCVNGAFTKREDGVVIQDAEKCTGCRLCSLTCPHGAPRYSPRLGKVSKCDFCADRLAALLSPACVAACPTGALTVIDIAGGAPPGALAAVPGFPGSTLTAPALRFTIPHRFKREEDDEP